MRDAAAISMIILVFVVFWAAWVWVLQWAWNTAVAPIFGLSAITYLQAFAISLLIAAVTGGSRKATS